MTKPTSLRMSVPPCAPRCSSRRLFGLASDGKTDRMGLPKPLQLASLAIEFSDEVRLAWPPVIVQRVLFVPLAALGRLAGYRGWYPRYSANPIHKRFS